MGEGSEPLIITGSLNGLLNRIGRLNLDEVLLDGRKILKKAKKLKIKSTMRISEVLEMTALRRHDLELFITDIPLIEVVEPGTDPLLSFREVYCWLKSSSGLSMTGN